MQLVDAATGNIMILEVGRRGITLKDMLKAIAPVLVLVLAFAGCEHE